MYLQTPTRTMFFKPFERIISACSRISCSRRSLMIRPSLMKRWSASQFISYQIIKSKLNAHLKTAMNDCGVSIHNLLQIFGKINELVRSTSVKLGLYKKKGIILRAYRRTFSGIGRCESNDGHFC